MFKFLLYTALFSTGSYYAAQALPDSFKEKMLSAIGFGALQERRIEIFNPAAKREQLLDQLEKNTTEIKNTDNSGAVISTPEEKQERQETVEKLQKENEKIITKLKELNPKTGAVPQILEKILGLQPPKIEPVAPAPNDTQLKELISQLSPEVKAQICNVK